MGSRRRRGCAHGRCGAKRPLGFASRARTSFTISILQGLTTTEEHRRTADVGPMGAHPNLFAPRFCATEMQPLVIFDKSVLQMLRPSEIEELTHCFDFICVPTLIREIIGDLRKPPSATNKVPVQAVRAWASRLSLMDVTTPVNFRKAALGNMYGAPVPMAGRVPLDTSSKNVHASPDDKYLVYDATVEQELWNRWSRGDFSTDDAMIADAWRDGLNRVDMKAIGLGWRAFIDEHIGRGSSVDEIVAKVDRLISDPASESQIRAAVVLLRFLRADILDIQPFALAHSIDSRVTIIAFAPYAASVLRLYLTFLACVSYGLVQLRPSNYVDLQYLFYAPFAMGFASNDNLHKRLWSAASGSAILIDGGRLQEDLMKRVAWRTALTADEKKQYYVTHSFYPVEMEGSIVDEVWRKWMMPRERYVEALRNRRPIEEVQSEIGPDLSRMTAEMKALMAQKEPHAGEWPLGPAPGSDTPEP
jgi:hypothetical protein